MSDLFHDAVPDDYIEQVFDVMETATRHTFQLLTKRHARMRSFVTGRQRAGRRAGIRDTDPEPRPAAAFARKRARSSAEIWLGVSPPKRPAGGDPHAKALRRPLSGSSTSVALARWCPRLHGRLLRQRDHPDVRHLDC